MCVLEDIIDNIYYILMLYIRRILYLKKVLVIIYIPITIKYK